MPVLQDMMNKENDARAPKESQHVNLHTSGGVFVAVSNHFTSFVAVDGGKDEGVSGHAGRIAEVRMKCEEGFHVSAVYF